MNANPFRNIPSVAKLLALEPLVEARLRYPLHSISQAVRTELARLREQIVRNPALQSEISHETIVAGVLQRLDAEAIPSLRPVINATGIVLHTNLGRAPLHEEAARAAYEAGRGYLNLELDLATGKRGSRQTHVRAGLCAVTGAEAATVVNNCAAATVLVLRAIAPGKEVIVSRGQLIEIGGAFRIPDIMAVSGATLREVGTTNITRVGDYQRAISANTAALMRVHTSNYRVRGFTRAVELSELVELGRQHRLTVIDDLGSGQVVDLAPFGLPGEPLVSAGVAAGADLVLFSGDKLLGGPQAGIIVGKAPLIHRLEKDPLMRALRLDKMTLAALESTVRLYQNPEQARREIPTLRMLTTPLSELRERAERFAVRLRTLDTMRLILVSEDQTYAGGGSLPDVAVPTVVIEAEPHSQSEAELVARLRVGLPTVVARTRKGRLILDLRTVFVHQENALWESIRAASQASSGA